MVSADSPTKTRRYAVALAAFIATLGLATVAHAALVVDFQTSFATPLGLETEPVEPNGVAVAPDGRVLIASNEAYISSTTSQGVPLAKIGLGADVFGPGAGFDQVADVVSRGNLIYACDRNRGVAVLALDTGAVLSSTSTIGGVSSPDLLVALAVDSAGSHYVLHENGLRVSKVDTSGALICTIDADASRLPQGHLMQGNDIAVAPSGAVYVADTIAGKIWRYTPTDPSKTAYTLAGQNMIPVLDDIQPRGVQVAPNGAVLVTDETAKRVYVLSADLKRLIGSWGGEGTTDGKFKLPWGISTGPNSTVWVGDRDRRVIQRFRLADHGPHTQAKSSVTVKKGKSAKFTYRVDDDFDESVTARIVISKKKGGAVVKTIQLGSVVGGDWRTKSTKITLAKGVYIWKVRAVDAFGNAEASPAGSKTLTVK
jgi:sugar lactone lactonase YvrE